MKATTTQTFSELLREGNHFTDRDFMKALAMGHPKFKAREADPSLFTVGELMLLATLLGQPIRQVMEVVLAEAERNPAVVQKSEGAKGQVVGRKNFPRKSKGPEADVAAAAQ
jgi:hypothetical protein